MLAVFLINYLQNKIHSDSVNLKPFIVVEGLNQDKRKYKLYHQSLVEFLKREYFDDGSENRYFIYEQDAHKKIVENIMTNQGKNSKLIC